MVTEIIVISILLIICILFFIFRFQFFYLVPEDFLSEKFGTYGPPIENQCISYDGKCSSSGFGNVSQNCIRNPITKRGCISYIPVFDNSNLKRPTQTFNDLKTLKKCQPTCKSSIWSENKMSVCMSDNICFDEVDNGYRIYSKTCVSNDATGPNFCTYPFDGNPIPSGCQVNSQTVECQVGSIYSRSLECKSTSEKCGYWGVLNQGVPELCDANQTALFFTPYCRNFTNGEYIKGDENIFQHGFYSLDMNCYGSVCKEIACNKNNINLIKENLNKGVASIGCSDIGYVCHKPCMYLNTIEGNWNIQIKNLIGNFSIITKSFETSKFFLTLEESPCSSINLSSTRTKKDCFGDPLGILRQTKCTFMDSGEPFKGCTIPEIILMTGLLVTIKPTRNYNGNPNVIYCNLIAIWGDQYKGVLNYRNGLVWDQADFSRNLEIKPTEFILVYNGLFSLRLTNGDVIIINNTNMDGLMFEYNESFTNNDASLNIQKFNDVLNQRGSRLNPNSCNIMYSYPPPVDYSGN